MWVRSLGATFRLNLCSRVRDPLLMSRVVNDASPSRSRKCSSPICMMASAAVVQIATAPPFLQDD